MMRMGRVGTMAGTEHGRVAFHIVDDRRRALEEIIRLPPALALLQRKADRANARREHGYDLSNRRYWRCNKPICRCRRRAMDENGWRLRRGEDFEWPLQLAVVM